MTSLLMVTLLGVSASCPTEAQAGVFVAKSDQMAKVSFVAVLKQFPASSAAINVGKAPLPNKQRKSAGPINKAGTNPPFPVTKDVPHTTDTTDTFACLTDTGGPPDTNGAVGPKHLFTALNYRLHAQKKDGSNIGTVYPWDFWQAVAPNLHPFDPRVVFDPHAQRWFMTYCAGRATADACLLIGVSETDDPTGNWFVHRVKVDQKGEYWIDFQVLGLNQERLVVTGSLVPRSGTTVPPRFSYFVFDKKHLLNGGPGSHTKFVVPYSYSGNPAFVHDKGVKELVIVQTSSNYSEFCLFEITGETGAMKLNAVTRVKPKWNWTFMAPEAPQAGSRITLDSGTGDGQVVIRNQYIWMVHSVNPTSKNYQRASLQWWQIERTGAVVQQGFLDDPTGRYSYVYPSIAVNGRDDVLIGYTRCSADSYPTGSYSYRRKTDAGEELRGDFQFKAGELPYTKSYPVARWGDYSSSCVDPVSDELWTLQQFSAKDKDGGNTEGLYWKKLK
jgi:hypothetical protein